MKAVTSPPGTKASKIEEEGVRCLIVRCLRLTSILWQVVEMARRAPFSEIGLGF